MEIKNCRFYDLRGSFATKSLRDDVEIKDFDQILGNSRLATTENYYISSTDENRKKATELFEQQIHSDVINNVIEFK